MAEVTLEAKILQIKKLILDMEPDGNNGALDILNALIPLNIIQDIETDDSKTVFIIKLQKYKTKLNSISELVTLSNEINSTLSSSMPTAELRAWVDKIKSTHYKVVEELQDNKYYQDISNEIGARTLGHTADTQSLSVELWGNAIAYRSSVRDKINSLILDDTNASYKILNEMMIKQISSNANINTDTEYTTQLEEVIKSIRQKLETLLDDSIRLINYLYPINTSISIENDLLIITSDENEIVIDIKGNKKLSIAQTIDNSVLTPVLK